VNKGNCAIKGIDAIEILDSRGYPTLRVTVELDSSYKGVARRYHNRRRLPCDVQFSPLTSKLRRIGFTPSGQSFWRTRTIAQPPFTSINRTPQ
jgi:hypothetical protein